MAIPFSAGFKVPKPELGKAFRHFNPGDIQLNPVDILFNPPVQSSGHPLQSRGHPVQSRGHTLQSSGHTLQSRGHPAQSRGHTLQSRGREISIQGTVHLNPGDGRARMLVFLGISLVFLKFLVILEFPSKKLKIL